MDKDVNRIRVGKWREKKFGQGFKSLTVYLPPDVLKMIKYLRRHLRLTRRNSELIALAIKTLYDNHKPNTTNILFIIGNLQLIATIKM